MKLVQKMTLDPNRCIACGKGNTPDGDTGEIGPFIDLETEVGWQDHAYLCCDCGTRAGALAGMISKDEAQDAARQIRKLQAELHDAQAKLEHTQRRLKGTQAKLLRV